MSRYRDQVENILGEVKFKFDFEEGWTVEFNERQKQAIEFMRSVDKAAAKRGEIESRKVKNWWCTLHLYDDIDPIISDYEHIDDLHMLLRYVHFVVTDAEEYAKYYRLMDMINADFTRNSRSLYKIVKLYRKMSGLYPKE